MNNQYNICKLRNWITLDKLHWNYLSNNPNAIYLLEKNLDKNDWEYLSLNLNVIYLLEQNFHKINQERLSENSSIFTYDYEELKKRIKETIAEDLMKNCFHPRNMNKWIDWGQEDIEFKIIYFHSIFQNYNT